MNPIDKLKADITSNQEAAQKAADKLDRLRAESGIIRAASDRFHDVSTDVVFPLLDRRKSVDITYHDGKPTGEVEHHYDPIGDGEYLPIDKALDVWAENHPHHVKPQPTNPEARRTPTAPPRRGNMTIAQKVDFINKHGGEAFRKLGA